MAHAQKPDFVFPRNGRVHLNRWGASVQSTAGSRGVRIGLSNAGSNTFGGGVRVLATHFIRQFPLHFPYRASPCATRFRTSSTGSFPVVKRPGRGVDHPPSSSVEVKERVQLYIYSLFGTSWPLLGWSLTLCSFVNISNFSNYEGIFLLDKLTVTKPANKFSGFYGSFSNGDRRRLVLQIEKK